jgi:5-methylcytosine-specific restriction endonuclease McrA
MDSWKEHDGNRYVFKFRLDLLNQEIEDIPTNDTQYQSPGRIIPTAVKLEVWKRDKGKCVECGSTENLHFDHIIPYSKGGSSTTAQNIQLLCSKHNLEKRDQIK